MAALRLYQPYLSIAALESWNAALSQFLLAVKFEVGSVVAVEPAEGSYPDVAAAVLDYLAHAVVAEPAVGGGEIGEAVPGSIRHRPCRSGKRQQQGGKCYENFTSHLFCVEAPLGGQ